MRIYSRAITPREVQALSAVGAPPQLSIARSGPGLTITWPAGLTGFILQSADSLPAALWTPVAGITNNSAQITLGKTSQFFRLSK